MKKDIIRLFILLNSILILTIIYSLNSYSIKDFFYGVFNDTDVSSSIKNCSRELIIYNKEEISFLEHNNAKYINLDNLNDLFEVTYNSDNEIILQKEDRKVRINTSTNSLYLYYNQTNIILNQEVLNEDNNVYVSLELLDKIFGINVYCENSFISIKDKYEKIINYDLIAHALGGINGHTYLNSKESFNENYQKGYKLFEVDIIPTLDGKLVARHDWNKSTLNNLNPDIEVNNPILSYEYFINSKIKGEYTPLSLEDVLVLINDNPDTYLILDTKGDTKEEVIETYTIILEEVNDLNPTLISRIIPQIYNQEMYHIINELHSFDNYIYTLYLTQDTNTEVLQFAKSNGIKIITMPEDRASHNFIQRLNQEGLFVYVHTINNVNKKKELEQRGVYGVYTDFIVPQNEKGE